MHVLARNSTVVGENGGSVTPVVLVHQINRLHVSVVKRRTKIKPHRECRRSGTPMYIKKSTQAKSDQHGAENLLRVTVHGSGDVSKDGRTHEVALWVSWHLDMATIKKKLRDSTAIRAQWLTLAPWATPLSTSATARFSAALEIIGPMSTPASCPGVGETPL